MATQESTRTTKAMKRSTLRLTSGPAQTDRQRTSSPSPGSADSVAFAASTTPCYTPETRRLFRAGRIGSRLRTAGAREASWQADEGAVGRRAGISEVSPVMAACSGSLSPTARLR